MKEFDEIEKALKEMENDKQILQEAKGMDEKIRKMIDRRIRKICLKTLAVVMGILVFVLFGINPLMKASYFNPMKMQGDENDVRITPYQDELTDYLHAYYETMFPYLELVYAEATDKGFGEYDIRLGIYNHLEDRRFNSNINATPVLNLKRNKVMYENDPFGVMVVYMGRFDSEWMTKESAVESISGEPDRTDITIAISARKERPITDVMKDSVTLEWVEVYTPDSMFQGGLNMNLSIKTRELAERENGEEALCQTYKNNLDRLLAEPVLLNALGVHSSKYSFFDPSFEEMKKTRELIEKETQLKTKNYCVSGTREEILNYLEKVDAITVCRER